MSVIEYVMRFIDLSRHDTVLIPSKEKRVRRFIDVLHHGICITMAREVETETSFH